MDKSLRDGRLVSALLVWGSHMERVGNRTARALTDGLNWRDLLLLAIVYDRGGQALPSELIGPVFTTAPGVSSSVDRLERAELVTRGVGTDARTRPLTLTPAAGELAASIVEPWARFVEEQLANLDDAERTELYRLVVKGTGLWQGVWPETAEEG